jgi:hypothetical protein
VLIFIGGVFLLENTGYLPPNAWLNLWRLWPLLLVLAGIELLFAHRVPWIALAALATVVLVVGVAATTFTGFAGPSTTPSTTSSARTDLAGATQAAVTIRYGAGQLNVGPLVQSDPGELAMMTFSGPSQLAPQPRYTPATGGVGRLEYQMNERPGPSFLPFISDSDTARLDVNLNPNVPITLLTIQMGATDAHLDLSSLQVNSLDMSVGAAAAQIRLPQVAGTSTAHISGGMSTVTLEIPQGVAAQIRHRGGLSTLNVDPTRFPSVDGATYRSPDYATAQSKVDLTLETGVTKIQVN